VALASVIVISHLGAGYFLLVASNAGSNVFGPPGESSLIDQATPAPSLAPGQTQAPTASPLPTPVIGGRVTILFTGVDSAPTRGEHLYDSIMVVSYDPKTNSVQMVSVPRDSASFPFYFGGVDSVTVRINSIPTYVKNGWIRSPDDPYTTLVKEVSYLVGIPINYYAVMDMAGFVKMIDAIGGIDVVNDTLVNDTSYEWPDGTTVGFYLDAGPQHLDGIHALAYVTSRHGSSDWTRSSRQQEVLVALLHQMAQPSKLMALPGLISTLGSSVATTFPSGEVADYVAIGQDVPSGNFSQVVLGPPYTILGVNNLSSADTTCLLNDKVADLSIQLFGADSLWFGKPAPANTCPQR
jgi:LCP family protein required for cell wall assembly